MKMKVWDGVPVNLVIHLDGVEEVGDGATRMASRQNADCSEGGSSKGSLTCDLDVMHT